MGASSPVRNLALVGPNGSGKTTLLESLLFVSGATTRKGRVADRNTVGDASAESRDRQMSTELSVASFRHGGFDFTVIDCPGSVEFAHEARQALVGVDLAVVVVEPVAERMVAVAPLLQYLDQLSLPHLVFINKMDRSEAPFRDLLQALRDSSARPVVPHQYAIGRGESLVGYIDLVTEQAYAFRPGAPADRIPLPFNVIVSNVPGPPQEFFIAGRAVGIGREKGEVLKDEEGLQLARSLGQRMAFLLKKLYG